VHLVGYIIRIYHDARSPECQKNNQIKLPKKKSLEKPNIMENM